jgi:hypothetical protein
VPPSCLVYASGQGLFRAFRRSLAPGASTDRMARLNAGRTVPEWPEAVPSTTIRPTLQPCRFRRRRPTWLQLRPYSSCQALHPFEDSEEQATRRPLEVNGDPFVRGMVPPSAGCLTKNFHGIYPLHQSHFNH